MNQVELCNLALGRIGVGASNPIQSLTTDTSEEARACARVFAPAMQQVLRAPGADWAFCRKARALEPVSQTVPGWAYVYAYPVDCLRIQALSDSQTDPFRTAVRAQRIAYKLMAATSGEAVVIATDQPDAWAWYTRDATNPHFGDALFQDALAWRIAMEVALGLKADPRLATFARESYSFVLSQAGASAANEEVDDGVPMTETEQAYR